MLITLRIGTVSCEVMGVEGGATDGFQQKMQSVAAFILLLVEPNSHLNHFTNFGVPPKFA